MVGRASLTPGRVVALLGLVAVLSGLATPARDGQRHWEQVDGAVRQAVVAATAVLLAATFRPHSGRTVDVVGAAAEHVVAWSAVVLAANRLMAAPGVRVAGGLVAATGAFLLVAGASWDLAEATRRGVARARSPDRGAGGHGRLGGSRPRRVGS